ncbi:sugar porter family MFS transporter [Flavitalea flava]
MPITTFPGEGTSGSEKANYRRRYLYLVCAIASLGGLLFGFDLVIISGAIPFFSTYFKLSEAGVGWAVGCINLGSALGALIAGRLSESLGRKKLLLLCAFLFALTGIGTGWAGNIPVFIFFRLLSGVAVGVAALVCPMYIAEIAPTEFRGRMVTFYQLAIVSGLLLAYLADYLLLDTGINNWRWMFSSQSVPALLFFFGLFLVSESPRWLIRKNRLSEAGKILLNIGGPGYAQQQVKNIKQSFASETKENWKDLFQKKYRRIILLGVIIAVCSQLDGQNSLFSYAPEIFKQAGMARDSAFLQSVILGLINFVFTFVAIGTIDRKGRRKLLLVGSVLLCLDALGLSLAFALPLPAPWILGFVLGFIAIYAATLGPVTWVTLSELFPNKVRGSLMALATLSLWIANFLTTASFPIMKTYWGLPVTFGIHALICMVYFLFIYFKVPETKGKSLEEIEGLLVGK